MMFPNRETVWRLREQYPAGCRIVLDSMDDPWTRIPEGMQGVCQGVDDGERYAELERKLSLVEEKLKALSAERSDREYKARQCELFLDKVKRLNLVDAETFMALVDKVVVGEGMKFILKYGSEWELEDAPLDGDEAQEKKNIGEASGVA